MLFIALRNSLMRVPQIRIKSSVFIFFVLACNMLNAANYQPFLWKVQNQGTVVYLAGSIHALTPDFYPLPQAYQDAFAEADRIAVELDPTTLDAQKSYQLVQSKMWLPQGVTLKAFLSQSELETLKTFTQEAGGNFDRTLRTRPWMLVEQLTQAQLKDSEFQADYGLDLHFLKQAKQKALPILELETLTQQISAIADAPFKGQLAMLKTALEQMDDKDYLRQMTTYWQQGDADGLYHFVYQDVLKNPNLKPMMESLLDKRNLHMADVISIYLGQAPNFKQTTFVVVGALHLSGPNSIQVELERKGFRVQKVKALTTEQ